MFDNTAGGALPSTIERVSNYTPLNTSNFNHVLSAADNNLQAAMDTIDEHTSYTLVAGGSSFSPAKSTTYYFGSLQGEAPTSTALRARLYLPKGGLLTSARIFWMGFNAGHSPAT